MKTIEDYDGLCIRCSARKAESGKYCSYCIEHFSLKTGNDLDSFLKFLKVAKQEIIQQRILSEAQQVHCNEMINLLNNMIGDIEDGRKNKE